MEDFQDMCTIVKQAKKMGCPAEAITVNDFNKMCAWGPRKWSHKVKKRITKIREKQTRQRLVTRHGRFRQGDNVLRPYGQRAARGQDEAGDDADNQGGRARPLGNNAVDGHNCEDRRDQIIVDPVDRTNHQRSLPIAKFTNTM